MSADALRDRALASYAERRELPATSVRAEWLDGVDTAPFAVVRVHGVRRGRPFGREVVALSEAEEHWGFEPALTAVLGAWGYGPERSRPPADVAAVAGFLETRTESTTPLLRPKDWAHVRPEWAAHVERPQELTVEGQPAVAYWVTSAKPPLWRSVLVVTPEGPQHSRTRVEDMD